MIRFDAYTATTTAAKPGDMVGLMVSAFGLDTTLKPGRGFHTFGERISVRDHTGDEVGSVSHGGSQGDRVMIEVKGRAHQELSRRCGTRTSIALPVLMPVPISTSQVPLKRCSSHVSRSNTLTSSEVRSQAIGRTFQSTGAPSTLEHHRQPLRRACTRRASSPNTCIFPGPSGAVLRSGTPSKRG